MAVGPATVSILLALFANNETPPARQFAFAKAEDCRVAMKLYNDSLPQVKKVFATVKNGKRRSEETDKIIGYACIDGITEQVEYSLGGQ